MSGSRRLFDKILSSDCKADPLILFNQNAKLVESPDGLAWRIGRALVEINEDLRDLEDVGLLSKERDRGAPRYNGRRAAEIQQVIATHITTKLE